MFKSKENKKMWIVLILIVVLVAIIIVLQTQMLAMLQDLQTNIFGSFYETSKDWVMDANPLPPAKDWVMDANPLPPAKTF
jgi:flagellar basal body-associated protein FliL